MIFLFFILACIGATSIIVSGDIFNPLRNFFAKQSMFLYKLVTCMQCSGFWVGATLSFLFPGLFYSTLIFNAFLGGVISSFTCNTTQLIINKFFY